MLTLEAGHLLVIGQKERGDLVGASPRTNRRWNGRQAEPSVDQLALIQRPSTLLMRHWPASL